MNSSKTRWHIEPAWRHVLPTSLDDLVQSPDCEPVKTGPLRSVYRIRRPSIDLHVKECRPVGVRAWFREWFRPAKAILEFQKIVQIARRKIATLEPVAYGQHAGIVPGASFLLTRSVTDSAPLGQYLETAFPLMPENQRFLVRQQLAVALGFLLADLHDAGILHPDLHPGNLLLTWQDGRPRLVLIDLHDVQVLGSLSRRQRLDNLVLFNRWFILRTNRTDRLRFWKAYSKRLGSDESGARETESSTVRSNLRFWRGRMRRCLGTNRHFQTIVQSGMSGHAIRSLTQSEWMSLIDHARTVCEDPTTTFIKNSRSTKVAEIETTVGGVRRRVILKRVQSDSIVRTFASFLRPRAMIRAWQNGHAFRDGLLPTPRPLAVWHHRRSRFGIDAYFVSEKVENATHLKDYLATIRALPNRLGHAFIISALFQLARIIRTIHEQGWSHRDLKASNILFDGDGRISLIDLVGARRPARLTFTRRAQDLARLNVSFLNEAMVTRSVRLRFLHAYLNRALNGTANWKVWWRKIARATETKRRRNLKNGRSLN